MAEFLHDGSLVRQHHLGTMYRISRIHGAQYRIQRARGSFPTLYCPSPYVSNYHCEINRRDGVYWIKDVGSTNGTYLNGHMIIPNTERELRFGDIIGLGLSHVEIYGQINPMDDQCFIFAFVQATVDFEEAFAYGHTFGFHEELVVED